MSSTSLVWVIYKFHLLGLRLPREVLVVAACNVSICLQHPHLWATALMEGKPPEMAGRAWDPADDTHMALGQNMPHSVHKVDSFQITRHSTLCFFLRLPFIAYCQGTCIVQ